MVLELYLDESGNLADELPYFVIATFSAGKGSRKKLTRLPKKIRQKILDKELHQVPELKFHNSNETTRQRFLKDMVSSNPKISILALDKKGRQIIDTPENYGSVVGELLQGFLPSDNDINLIIDKKYTKPADRETFDKTVKWLVSPWVSTTKISINHLSGSQENLLQVADFIAGAVLQSLAFNKSKYLQIIRPAIRKWRLIEWTELKYETERRKWIRQ